jgi:hypothetical protein
MAAVGPFGSAAAQFALSLTLLRHLPQGEFGIFSFLIVTLNFILGVWGALFCAPLPTLIAREQNRASDEMIQSLFACNLVGAATACAVFVLLGTSIGAPFSTAFVFGCYAAVALLRSFARAFAYATGRQLRSMSSDLVYCVALITFVAVAFSFRTQSLDTAFMALLLGVTLGLLPFGTAYLDRLRSSVSFERLRNYRTVWRRHTSWSLLGVITGEATSNAHSYIVTSFFGPSAFAPVAASSLITRPFQVTSNALEEFERAQMARELGGLRFDTAKRAVRFFRLIMFGAWAVTASAAMLVLSYWPGLLFPPHYDVSFLRKAALLWLTTAAVRVWRTPESALLQAAGEFRPLAFASVLSAGVSITMVAVLLSMGGVIWSLGGIVVGEVVFAGWTRLQARRWFESRSQAAHRAGTMIGETVRS